MALKGQGQLGEAMGRQRRVSPEKMDFDGDGLTAKGRGDAGVWTGLGFQAGQRENVGEC